MPSFIKTDDYITVALDEGETATFYASSSTYAKAIGAIKDNDMALLKQLVNPSESIEKQFKQTLVNGRLVIEHGVVYVDSVPIHNTLAQRIVEMIDEGFDVTGMALFLVNLTSNPSYRAVNELYGFLEYSKLPITEDGCFVAYKRVRDDYKDIYTGTIDNSIGQVVEMDRNQVNDDCTQTCSQGLHFCSREYLSSYGTSPGNRTVVVKINPADVVSIPIDYNNTKGRCCKYEVIGELEHSKEDQLEDNLVFDYKTKIMNEVVDEMTEKVAEAMVEESEYDFAEEDYDDLDEFDENATRYPPIDGVFSSQRGKASRIEQVVQINLLTNVIVNSFETPRAAALATGIDVSNIKKVLHGERKSAGGFGWKIIQ